jgi:hypothetical protein
MSCVATTDIYAAPIFEALQAFEREVTVRLGFFNVECVRASLGINNKGSEGFMN